MLQHPCCSSLAGFPMPGASKAASSTSVTLFHTALQGTWCCVTKIFSAEQESQSHLQPALWALHIFFGTSLLAALFCYVRVKAPISACQVLCVSLPYFPTKLSSQEASVPVHLPPTPAITPPISSMVLPELPGIEYFTFIIWFWKYCFYFTCVVERIFHTIWRLSPTP